MASPPHLSLPQIDSGDSFDRLVRKLCEYFVEHVDTPHTWEDLRKTAYQRICKPLIRHLVRDVHHPALISALLALKWHFEAVSDDDNRGINVTRGLACELVAWRVVIQLNETEAIDCLCYELPGGKRRRPTVTSLFSGSTGGDCSPLLAGAEVLEEETIAETTEDLQAHDIFTAESFAVLFEGLTALEIAAVAGAKKFFAQSAIQRVVDGLWHGDIVFWETLRTNSTKSAQVYDAHKSDPYSRLRVPRYLKIFEVFFFAAFLGFYYTVLIAKPAHSATTSEILLYVWLASFTYNELVEYWDAGQIFYATDFWALWDLGIIAVGWTFFALRVVGLVRQDERVTNIAFDVLSVEALFLVPRICSLLSLHPYFGTLIPCLKEMTKDFVKFLGLVAILYLGFDTTFAFLARGTYSFSQMNWILIKVFFGSSYLGFDVAEEISPILGPPLMFLFVCMTNILLITSLISLLSTSLTKVIEHARDEYIFVYAVYVLEASTSNRLTHFYPPLNLLALLLRPLRLFMSADGTRKVRILVLKITHWPFVAMILGYERWRAFRRKQLNRGPRMKGPRPPSSLRQRPLSMSRNWTSTSGNKLHRRASNEIVRALFVEQAPDTLTNAAGRGEEQTEAALATANSLNAACIRVSGEMSNLTKRLAKVQDEMAAIVAAMQQLHGNGDNGIGSATAGRNDGNSEDDNNE